jgi:hypothetical protein
MKLHLIMYTPSYSNKQILNKQYSKLQQILPLVQILISRNLVENLSKL